MIFPLLNGILSIRRVPVTWAIFFLNLAVFLVTFNSAENTQARLEDFLKDDVFSRTQGWIFAKYIEDHGGRYPANMRSLASQALSAADHSKRRILGGMAMRDSRFLVEGASYNVTGDRVALGWWRKKFNELELLREQHPSYNLGLTQDQSGFLQWLTYQFAHSGVSHFAGNMIFFLIFSSSLELVIGGVGVLLVYLLSGIAAALSFLFLSEASAVPLIGASGAVSGLMALFCVLYWNRGVRYVYFLLVPKSGFAGVTLLPAWVILGLWLLSDLAGFWSTPSEFGGIAYSAHLGGELFGALVGLALRPYWLSRIDSVGNDLVRANSLPH